MDTKGLPYIDEVDCKAQSTNIDVSLDALLVQDRHDNAFADEIDFLKARTLLIARARQLQDPQSIQARAQAQEIEELLQRQQAQQHKAQVTPAHVRHQDTATHTGKVSFTKNVLKPLCMYVLMWFALLIGGTLVITLWELDNLFLAGVLASIVLFAPVFALAVLIRYVALVRAHHTSK